jgi:hypothetical protein
MHRNYLRFYCGKSGKCYREIGFGYILSELQLLETEMQKNNRKDPAVYEIESKIFRTDAVKIIKLTIRPIGRHHPLPSSLPHVDTGPTVSSIFGKSFSVRESRLFAITAWISSMVSNRCPFRFNFIFGNSKKSQGPTSREYVGWGMTAISFIARNYWVRTEV